MESGLTPPLVRAWLEARSVARRLPSPIDDCGGYRVDTRSCTEIARWIFPEMCSGLVDLGWKLTEPRHFIKLCGTIEELCAVLPVRWRPHALGYFMALDGLVAQVPIPMGYVGEVEKEGSRTSGRIVTSDGTAVATGYAAETEHVYIYDRITTDPLHRRKGLASALISLLRENKSQSSALELLVATEEGRKLYEALGWRTMSSYSTASIPPPERTAQCPL